MCQKEIELTKGGLLWAEKVEKDFVIFKTARVYGGGEEISEAIIDFAKSQDRNKVVLRGIGGIDNYKHDLGIIKERVEQAGIEIVVIDIDARAIHDFRIGDFFTNFEIEIASWRQAKWLEICLPHLVEIPYQYAAVLKKIEDEKKLLVKFPVHKKVDGLEFHPLTHPNREFLGKNFSDIFPSEFPDTKARGNWVVLFTENGKEGVLISKSQQIYFDIIEEYSIPEFFSPKKLFKRMEKGHYAYDHTSGKESSIKISLKSQAISKAHLSLFVDSGIWRAEPHPPIEKNNPLSIHRFIPLWQRMCRLAM